ncbi:TonB-dependent receptor [Ramlibacter tataouinensis]|nr:TonB-dependent receptor [Ramlibacter tataouinensis]
MSAAVACLGLGAHAQSQPDSPAVLPQVTVTGNPLGATDLAVPAERYGGTGLLLRSQSTLGETLNHTPGVSSTGFGPNASRPVIRGLDGDRIRILNNGGASVDASGLSFDHAVPLDPIAVDSIEVLRGPGALLYGGSAVGGVVNVIDNRIPRAPVQGLTGRLDASYATGAREKAGAAMVEGGNERFALHVDAFGRDARDVRVPVTLPCTRGDETRLARRVCNSAAESHGGALGGSVFLDRGGYLGASVASFRKDYGTVAEDEVTIDMKSDRYALEGLWRAAGGPVDSIKAQFGHTDYRHTEFDAGEAGTLFRNRGNDWRIELRHRPLGPLEGVAGLQGEHTRFAADGEEAFAPYSRTRQQALFVYEELATGWGKLTFGGRTESVRVESLGNPEVDRFATGGRRFRANSYALGALWQLAPAWQLSGNLAHTERAPRDYELFANGPHVATGAYELGDATLDKERSDNLDLGLQWKQGPSSARLGAFVTRFRNYISLESTGAEVETEEGEFLPGFAYRQVPARFQGLEADGTARLLERGHTLDLEWRGDLVRATHRGTGEPLPRIPPARAGATLVGARGPWSARVGFDAAARQDRVPEGERETGGYTLWHAALTYRTKAGLADALWYARLDNATDKLAYSATSILTQTAPGRSPLAGRSLRLGVQANF